MNIERIRRLIHLVEESKIDSLEIRPLFRTAIKITRSQPVGTNGSASTVGPDQITMMVPAPPLSATPSASIGADETTPSHLVEITAPMVGTFYLAASPDSQPFVNVGQTIAAGETVCIIEAMKLMNEIEAEQGGMIKKIVAENAQPVEFGQVLFLLDPNG